MLRRQHLAHSQLPKAPVAPAGPDIPEQHDDEGEPPVWATDDAIETIYQDNLEIMRLLLSLVQALAFDLSEVTEVYKHHAQYFWASACGKRTEGHPDCHLPLDRPVRRDSAITVRLHAPRSHCSADIVDDSKMDVDDRSCRFRKYGTRGPSRSSHPS
jgi:hypothetical protein